LRTALKGSRSLTKGYTVYLRSIVRSDQSALTYYGITFRHWLHRLKEHVAAANGGSPLLFHRALRDQLKGRSKISAHDHRRWPDQGRGQANRLSAEQVRQIRMLAALGHSTSAIVARSGASGADQGVRESSATGHTSASGDKA
jgi:hypothetical protein